jgi:hypothetical protein
MGEPIETKYYISKTIIHEQHYWFVLNCFGLLNQESSDPSLAHFSLGNVSLPHESQCPLLMKGCVRFKKTDKIMALNILIF